MSLLLSGAALGRIVVNRAVASIPTPPPDVDPSTGKGPEWGKAAPVGLLVILLLCIAMFFLMRSMNRKIKQVPASFDPPEPAPAVDVPAADSTITDPDQPLDESADSGSSGHGAPGLANERSG